MTGPLLAVDPTSGSSLLGAFGALAVLVVVFAESGLLVVGFSSPATPCCSPPGCSAPPVADPGPTCRSGR